MYEFVKSIRTLYSLLQDRLSREIFMAQMRLDIAPGMENAMELDSYCGSLDRAQALEVKSALLKHLRDLNENGEKLILHGTGTSGQKIASFLLADGIDFYGFSSRSAWRYPEGLMGKPAFTDEWLLEHRDEVYVLIAGYNGEVLALLRQNGFPEERIVPYVEAYRFRSGPAQYFEFPELFRRGTAFVDGGCFDGGDSIRFARWCGGEYSKIFAFEPDRVNSERCASRLEKAGVRNAEVVNAAMSDHSGTELFVEKASTGSFLPKGREFAYDPELLRETRVATVDDVVGGETVGMLKMDIEGAEFAALHGAANTIRRDKPLLAICVYHKVGDLPAIMDYCRQLVPEYRFWLRQYAVMTDETVLYASVRGQ